MFKLGISLIKLKLGKKAKPENIHKYLMSSKSEALLDIVNFIDHIADETKHAHQRNITREYLKFGLFMSLNNSDLRIGLENMLNKFTKYEDVKLDLKPNCSKFEQYIIDKALIYIIKKMASRQTYIIISSEAQLTTNKVAKYIIDNIDFSIADMKNEFTRKSIKSIIWISVWIMVNDTAYRPQFYYTLKHLGNNELSKLSEEFYFEPHNWYINIHTEAHAETQRLWAKNEIPMHENCLLENPCMARKQKEKIERIIKEIGGAH